VIIIEDRNYLERIAFHVFGVTLYNRVQARYLSLYLLEYEAAVLPSLQVVRIITESTI